MKRILVLFLIVAVAVPGFAQKRLTLQEAISIALQRNSALIKLKNGLPGSESQVLNAYGQLVPNLGAQAGWSWQRVNDVGGVQRDFFGNNVVVPPSQVDNRNYNIGIGGNVTLFNGLSNYANISQKKDNLKAAEYNIDKQKQNIVFQTADLYYTVLNAEEMLKVRDENVHYYQKFLETVQERNRLGAVAIADVYSAQVQLGNAELLLIQAQNAFEIAKSNLLNFLSLNILDDYTFEDPFGTDKVVNTDLYMKDFEDLNAMVSTALDTRFDYKSQALIVSAAENGVTIARSGVFPQLTGNYSYYTYAIEVNKLFNRKLLNFGLTLSIPIFSNFNVESSIQLATVNVKNAREDLTALQRQIKIEVKQAYLDLVAAKKSLDVAVKNVTAAEQTRRINQERYNLGSATILDVLQASRDYVDALRNKINAVYEFYRQHHKLNNALGRLDFSKYE